MFDVVIRGGTLVDGTGAPSRTGDVAIEGGRIAEVGGRIGGRARRVIDADGALVTPGFVDIHSHYDGQATWDDKIDPSFSNGITTTIMGNCGVGFAPARPHDRDRLIAVMEGVEAIPGVVLKEGVPWKWESFPEYMDFLAQRRFGIDLGVLVAHAPLRVFAMGERAVNHELATEEDVASMTAGVRAAMAAGAMGVSTGRIEEHMYGPDFAKVPGTFAEHDELIALAKAMAESGQGFFQVVPRGAIGGMVDGVGLSREARIAEHRLFERIARECGRPVHYLLQQFDTDPDDWKLMLEQTARARTEGLEMHAHIAARGFGMLSTLDGYHNFLVRPAYRAIAHLPLAERAAAMRDPALRATILGQADLPLDQAPDFESWGMANSLNRNAANAYLLAEGQMDYEPTPDQRVGAIAERTGQDPIAIIYDHMTKGDGRGLTAMMSLNYSYGDLSHVHAMLQDSNTLASLGDGGAHVRMIADVSMMPFHLSFWSRDRKRGPKLPLESMVAKITRANARSVGLMDRGELAVGQKADVNVIDFDALQLGLPKIVHDFPLGGARLDQGTSGFLATLLSGTVTRERDSDTGERPGRLIRQGGAISAPAASMSRSYAPA